LSGRHVDDLVRTRARSGARRILLRAALHQDLEATPYRLAVLLESDPLLQRHETLVPLRDDLGRDLVRHRSSFGVRPDRIFERVRRVEAGFLNEAQRVFEVLARLAWEAHDDIRRRRDAGDRGTDARQDLE